MNSRDKQWRKIVFQRSRGIILGDKLGFFWKILVFIIAMIAAEIIANFVGGFFTSIIGLIIASCIGVIITVLFNKFLLNSDRIERSATISDSGVSIKVYLNCLVWTVLATLIKLLPMIFIFTKIIDLFVQRIQGNGVRFSLDAIASGMILNLIISLIISFIIKIFFFQVNYLIIDGKETNFIKAMIRSVKMVRERFLSTIIVLLVASLQVFIIGLLIVLGLILSGIGILQILAFLFVVAALVAYYNFVQIKWYRFLNGVYENKKSNE